MKKLKKDDIKIIELSCDLVNVTDYDDEYLNFVRGSTTKISFLLTIKTNVKVESIVVDEIVNTFDDAKNIVFNELKQFAKIILGD